MAGKGSRTAPFAFELVPKLFAFEPFSDLNDLGFEGIGGAGSEPCYNPGHFRSFRLTRCFSRYVINAIMI